MMGQTHLERRTPTIRQFVMVVVAVTLLAMLLPVGAKAAGQLVTLTDSTTLSKARVDSGKLRVGDGSGPLTIDGQVATVASIPAKAFNTQGGDVIHGPDPLATTYAITTLVVTNEKAEPWDAGLQVLSGPTADSVTFSGPNAANTGPQGRRAARWDGGHQLPAAVSDSSPPRFRERQRDMPGHVQHR
jgi:hypothetical protein